MTILYKEPRVSYLSASHR